jgi:hypothetical protein
MLDELYSCYLHCVKGKALTVSMLFRHCKDDNRRIYVSEHFILHDKYHLQRSKEAEENEPERVLSVILLNGDKRIPSDAGELMKLTIVAENYEPAVADESMLLTVGA